MVCGVLALAGGGEGGVSMVTPVSSNVLRQAAWRARQAGSGVVAVKVMVPTDVADDFKIAAKRCAADRDLTIGTLVNRRTGRLASLVNR